MAEIAITFKRYRPDKASDGADTIDALRELLDLPDFGHQPEPPLG